MRIQVVGQKDVVDQFTILEEASGRKVTPARSGIDRTEFAFGLGEIAAVVTLVAFALQLAQQIHAIAQSIKAGDERMMRLKSSYGIVTIKLRHDTTVEELQGLLSRLEAPRE